MWPLPNVQAEQMKCHPAFHKHCPCVTQQPCMYVHITSVFGCVFRRGQLRGVAGPPGRLLYYFWEARSFPLEGLIEECWLAPSPPLRLRESGQARPSRLAGCSSTRNPLEPPWPAHGPAPTAPRYTHRWLDCLLAVERYIFTGVQQVDQGGSHPPL